tara:strand:+ start:211 stop:1224 length:1014 start_codon:yes stop_codon:yes gene_type:complete
MNKIYKLFTIAGKTLLLTSFLPTLIFYFGCLIFQFFGLPYHIETSPNSFFLGIDQAGSFWRVLFLFSLLQLLIILHGFLIKKYIYNINKKGSYLIIASMLFLNIVASIPNIHFNKSINEKPLINLADDRFPYYFAKSANVYYITKDKLENPHNNTYLMQLLLNKVNYYDYSVDGKPSKKINTQFLKFQREHGLSADGILGNETMKVFFKKLYISELKKINKNEELKKSVLQLHKNDSIWGLGIIYNSIRTQIPIYAYGLIFNEDPDNTSWIEIDSLFYKLVLKNHNIDIPRRDWLHSDGFRVTNLPNWNESKFWSENLDNLCDEFLDTLLVLSNKPN